MLEYGARLGRLQRLPRRRQFDGQRERGWARGERARRERARVEVERRVHELDDALAGELAVQAQQGLELDGGRLQQRVRGRRASARRVGNADDRAGIGAPLANDAGGREALGARGESQGRRLAPRRLLELGARRRQRHRRANAREPPQAPHVCRVWVGRKYGI